MTTAAAHEEQPSAPVLIGVSFGSLNSCIAIAGKQVGEGGCHGCLEVSPPRLPGSLLILTLTNMQRGGQPGTGEAIANEDGDRIIPSVVAYTGHEVLAGTQAKLQANSNPTGTIVQFRTLLGKKFTDPDTKDLAGRLAMTIVAGEASLPVYQTEAYTDADAGESVTESHTVVQVAAKYLTKLKETAENVLGKPVDGVVLSAPQHFEATEKAALLDASHEAGFAHTFTVHEPVAAALAFEAATASTSSSRADKLVLVLDLGGHQFNTTLLSCNDGVYTSLSSLDDHQLGGVHFDEVLVSFIREEFRKKYKTDISGNRRAMNKLRAACERTKRSLTRQETVLCSIESLYDGMDFSLSVNRARFEAMAEPLFARLAGLVRESLAAASVRPEQVAEVLLVGGASRMPRFQATIKSLFAAPGTVVRTDVEPDEAIALGCSIQAQLIAPAHGEYVRALGTKELLHVPQLAHAIGLAGADGQGMLPLLPQHAPLPARRTVEVGLASPTQSSVFLALYEGEAAAPAALLAELVLRDLPPTASPKGPRAVQVVVTVERDYSLSLVASCGGKSTRVQVPARG